MKEIYSKPKLYLVELDNKDVVMTSVAAPELLVTSGTAIGSTAANKIFE